ncbi:MAG: Lrp/AsnC family transcriptional regulator [Arenicella sp.]
MTVSIDKVDRKILDILQVEGRLSNQEVADRVNISAAACWRRIRALETAGVISRYVALLNRKALDLKFSTFVHVSLARHEPGSVERFEQVMLQRDDVLECHATTGDADFLLKVVSEDIESYNRFLEETIFTLPGILRVGTNITLREVKSETRIPLAKVSA